MVVATLLGVAQDGGLPHICCTCVNCRQIPPAKVACLALTVNQYSTFLIDATPDIKQQLATVSTWGSRLAGILLTHLHMGHYAGLMQLGKEALNTHCLPVYATNAVCTWLSTNQPWATYVQTRNIVLHNVTPNEPFHLSEGCTITPLPVPHRIDHSDTVAFLVSGSNKRLLYCPDTDGFAEWQPSLSAVLNNVDVALLDGTFFDSQELPNRDLRTIPHPMCCDTARILHAIDCGESMPTPTGVQCSTEESLPPGGPFSGALKGKEVALVHLNHSNPLWRPDSAQRRWLDGWGVRVAQEGDSWTL